MQNHNVKALRPPRKGHFTTYNSFAMQLNFATGAAAFPLRRP